MTVTKGPPRRSSIDGQVGHNSNGNVIGQYIIYIGRLSLPLWVLLSIGSLLFTTNLGGYLYLIRGLETVIPRPQTGPMDSALNVLVASFGEQTAGRDGPITPFEDGTKLAHELVDRLERAREQAVALTWGDVEFRFVNEVIAGDKGARQEHAAALAAKYRADVVIYGHFTHSRHFLPEFFISPRLGGSAELVTRGEPSGQSEHSGASAFGSPIAVPSRRFMDWAERRATVMASLGLRFDALTNFLFGLALYKGGNYSDAITMLQESLALDGAWKDLRGKPSDIGKEVVYLWIGTAAVEHARIRADEDLLCPVSLLAADGSSGDAERCAEAAYKQALAINDTYARARIGEGNIWFQRAERAIQAEDSTAACAALDRAKELYTVALDEGQSRPEGAYVTAKAHLNLGLSHAHGFRHSCGEASLARKELTAAVEMFRAQAGLQDAPFLRYIGTSALYQIGLLDLKEGHPLSAAERFQEVIAATGPYEPGEDWWREVRWFALSQQGQAFLDADKLEEAAAAFQQVVGAHEESLFLNDYVAADAYHSLGVIHNLTARYEQAIAVLTEGISVLNQAANPDDPYVDSALWPMRLELGDAYFNSAAAHAERLDLALAQYQAVRNRFEPDRDSLSSREYYTLGMAYCRIGRAFVAKGDTAAATALAEQVTTIPRLQGYEQTCNELRHAGTYASY